ncbi:MAG: hypothetical protein HY736_00590 [Verrucomicrobia bacterium]|nr:hypothetical protein [Verrucomicrobiota bacterium]
MVTHDPAPWRQNLRLSRSAITSSRWEISTTGIPVVDAHSRNLRRRSKHARRCRSASCQGRRCRWRAAKALCPEGIAGGG